MSVPHVLLLPAVLAAGLLVPAAATGQTAEPEAIPPITVPGAPDAPPPPVADGAAAPARPSSPEARRAAARRETARREAARREAARASPATAPVEAVPTEAAPAEVAPAAADGGDGRFWPVFGGVALALLVTVAYGARRLVPSRSAFAGSRAGRWIEMVLVSGMSFALLCTIAAVVVSIVLG